ncbi:uncharacterized protein LOC108820718 [Raphanus sativus]|uniref:Uncharacterized protein LOC108820718 n=1 Tax=Raphanus sativus TaxID=3726 RepID=A0A6J0KNR2_RAPSA|nr:uncharacterized protein LOC108820718 [Raphanus sativus]XP_018449227.2 uncharacterized protein LOC108820718 [Raphanus sativus]XP_018449228.2 uncharacterized protein LOC108820718 [Raphanus sativus]
MTHSVFRLLLLPIFPVVEKAYFSNRLWMFFRDTKETEEDIKRMFHQIRDSLKERITLEKKSDPGKFTIPCSVRGIEFPRALCDTRSGVIILPKIMADHLGLKIEPTEESFIFVDCSQQNSGGIVQNLEVQIGDAIIPTDFHVLDVKLNFKTSLLLGRTFLATVVAVCDLKSNKLYLTLIDPTIHYDPVQVIKLPRKESPSLVAACFCSQEYDSMAEYETEQDVSTDRGHIPSTDTVQRTRPMHKSWHRSISYSRRPKRSSQTVISR